MVLDVLRVADPASLVGLGAALCIALVDMALRNLGRTEDPLTTVFYFIMGGVLLSAPYTLIFGSLPDVGILPWVAGIGCFAAIQQVAKPCSVAAMIATCMAMAAQICETGPIAVEMAKYAIDKGIETDLATGLSIETNAYSVCIPTEDRLEGLAAFREKRKPVYRGK